MEERQTQQSTGKLWHIILMFQETSSCLWTYPGKLMTIIKFLFLIIACVSIEPYLFVASFLAMFPTEVSSINSTLERHIFLHNMESIMTTRRKEIWRIRRGVKSTNIIFRCSIYGSWEQIWGVSGFFMRVGSITNGDGR